MGKCELYHWVSVLDRFDSLLEKACSTTDNAKWQYLVDYTPELKELVLGILNFTALLIEYSCSRHIYGSIDHIITLLCVADLDVTLSVLNLLYVFSKPRVLYVLFVVFYLKKTKKKFRIGKKQF